MKTFCGSMGRVATPMAMLALAALAACGGGGGGTAATTVAISGRAADGPLQGATACYDLNDNGACDSNEPSATTDAQGAFSLDVPAAEAGKHRLVVEVPATAVDAETGAAVGSAFTLQSPATGSAGAQTVFASPLTTLVQSHIDATGATLADAVALVQTQAGLAVSPLTDFTAASNADNQKAAYVGRIVLLASQNAAASLASLVGTTDLSGSTITGADVSKAVTSALIGALPAAGAAATDPSVTGASGTQLQDALAAAAGGVAAQAGLTAPEVGTAIGVAKLPAETPPTTPQTSVALTALRFTNADDWYFRALEASAADNTPDANNLVRYYDVHEQSAPSGFSANGVVTSWGYGNDPGRAGDLHWNGSAWVDCKLGQRSTSSVRDAQGRNTYDYCDGVERGAGVRSAIDVSGQSIASVFTQKIRTFPGGANGVNYADWGPSDPAATFGSAVFPDGSKLLYQTNTVTASAFAYDVRSTNLVGAFSAAIAAGGDARANPGIACNVSNPPSSPVTSLEDLAARNPGSPCLYNLKTDASGHSLDPDEWWGNSTASLGQVPNGATRPAGTGTWFSTTLLLRVAFDPGASTARYYACLQRSSNGSPRNCSLIGTGTYAVQTLGDARVMTFTNLPGQTLATRFTRVFVERFGQVYFGYQNPVGVTTPYLRLNKEAANGVFEVLGLPPLRPITEPGTATGARAQALATAKGAWGGASATDALVFRFGDGGRFIMAQAAPENTQTREVTGSELGWIDVEPATGFLSSLLETDSNLTAGTSHPQPTDTVSFSDTAITTAGGDPIPRLETSANGIVGLWALGSATDFKTQHFAFFSNGRVLMIDPIGEPSGVCGAARQGPPGAEFAQYTYDANTGALHVFGKIYDTNGCAGLFDSSAGAISNGTANSTLDLTLTIANDGSTASATGPDGTFTLYRIANH